MHLLPGLLLVWHPLLLPPLLLKLALGGQALQLAQQHRHLPLPLHVLLQQQLLRAAAWCAPAGCSGAAGQPHHL